MPTYNNKVNAVVKDSSKEFEITLKEIIQEYGKDNIISEDGIAFRKKTESINLNELSNESSINWISRNTDIAKTNEKHYDGVSEANYFYSWRIEWQIPFERGLCIIFNKCCIIFSR